MQLNLSGVSRHERAKNVYLLNRHCNTRVSYNYVIVSEFSMFDWSLLCFCLLVLTYVLTGSCFSYLCFKMVVLLLGTYTVEHCDFQFFADLTRVCLFERIFLCFSTSENNLLIWSFSCLCAFLICIFDVYFKMVSDVLRVHPPFLRHLLCAGNDRNQFFSSYFGP